MKLPQFGNSKEDVIAIIRNRNFAVCSRDFSENKSLLKGKHFPISKGSCRVGVFFSKCSNFYIFVKVLSYCKWAYFWVFQNNGHIANGHICQKQRIMGIFKWAYSICPFLQMGIFFLKWAYLPNMPKKKTYGGTPNKSGTQKISLIVGNPFINTEANTFCQVSELNHFNQGLTVPLVDWC